jgi:hypothetical protein
MCEVVRRAPAPDALVLAIAALDAEDRLLARQVDCLQEDVAADDGLVTFRG